MSAPKIVTFYSYKGGTGRSMALANVAWILASNAKRVLVIDWDLEAPGLHRYFHPFLSDKELVRSDGLIDFVMQYAELAVTKTKRPRNWYLPYADLLRYACSLDFAFPNKGTIDFVPAGRQGADYATRVNAFNWQHFYERLSGGLFLEAVKLSMKDYDYVLIDSRTGVSDTSGICTIQMPDVLVVCFTLNTQSIEGAAAVAESADAQRRNANGDRTLHILPVPTRVELTERARLNAGMEAARKRFDPLLWHLKGSLDDYWARVSVQYQPFYAYEEVLAVFGDAPGNAQSMLASMEAVATQITGAKHDVRLPPSTPAEREQMLARYQRQQRQESPYLVRRLTEHTSAVRALAISPDGRYLLSADDTGTVLVSNLETGEHVRTIIGLAGNVRAAAFSKDGARVFIGSDSTPGGLWEIRLSDGATSIFQAGPVHALAVTSDGKFLLCGMGNSVSLVSLGPTDFGEIFTMGAHNGPVWAVAVAPGVAISGSFDKILMWWDLTNRRPLLTFSGHTGEVSSVAIRRSGRQILSGSYDNTLKLWALETASVLRTFEGHTGRVQAVALSPDGELAVSGSADKTVVVWEVNAGRSVLQLTGHLAAVNAVAITPDGRRAISASDDGTVIVWNIESALAAKPEVKEIVQPPATKPLARGEIAEGPLVYLSFSRRDRDRYFVQFVADLEEALRARGGFASAEEIIFWWDDSLYAGEEWPEQIRQKLQTARVALCLTSPAYFESENCGREFSALRTRSDRGTSGIYPIVWRPAGEWPDAIAGFERSGHGIGAYEQEGLAYMMRLSRHRPAYRQLLGGFAADLAHIALQSPLAPIAALPHMESLPNAFGSRDTRLPQAGPQRVAFFIAAQSPFGKPLAMIGAEVSQELDLYPTDRSDTDLPSLVMETATSASILVIVVYRAPLLPPNASWSHCGLLSLGGFPLPASLPPDLGYFAGSIETEAAFRDSLRNAIVKIQHAMIAKAALAGSGGGEPSEETPSLPNIA